MLKSFQFSERDQGCMVMAKSITFAPQFKSITRTHKYQIHGNHHA